MNSEPTIAHDLMRDGFLSLEADSEVRSTISATYRAAYAFFRLPSEAKLRNTLSEDCGYRSLGVEYSESPDRPDQMESFSATARKIDLTGLGTPEGRHLYQQMSKLIDLLEPLAEKITSAVETELSPLHSSVRTTSGAFREWSCLQLNYSRPAASTVEMINDPHEDGNFVTIAFADGPGLEIQTSSGAYVPVVRDDTSMIFMPGDIMYLMTGGRVKPLFHQVRRHADVTERLALLYFGDIDPARCTPWVLNEVNEGVDIGERSKRNSFRFGLEGFALEQ
jgi:isopenicillin N synthase-like dioxygenase